MLKARYKTKKNEILEGPVRERGGGYVFEIEPGRFVPYARVIEDAKFGTLTFIDVVEEKPPLPLPSSPDRDSALAELQAKLDAFPADYLEDLLHRERGFRKALDARNNFATATLAQIRAFSDVLVQEVERIEAARKAAEPPLQLGRYELTQNFYRSRADYGDLRIDGPEPKRHGTAACGFEDCEWWCYCGKCEKPGSQKRYTTPRILLEIEAGRRDRFLCQGPCRG